jgi:hypothetical protein
MMLLISLHDASIGHPVIGDKENVVTVPDEPRVVDHRAARGHGPRGREPERAPAELHELRHRLRHEHQIPHAATPLGAGDGHPDTRRPFPLLAAAGPTSVMPVRVG